MQRVGLRVLAICWSLALATVAWSQQSVTGATLAGIVQDPSGAVIRSASVTVISRSTGQKWSQSTAEDGRYKFNFLPVDEYRVRVSAPGFEPAQSSIRLLIGRAFDLPVRLGLPAAAMEISISSDADAVDTARTAIAAEVTPREVEQIPLNGRNYLDLALLVPGVSRTNTGAPQRFAETSAVPGTGISVASQRNLSNSFLVDGLSANDDAAELAGTFLSQEVIREFQVVTSGVAEFGRASSGVINIATKSGGNERHGSAYGFLRNQRLDAANPLSHSKLPLTQAQYGASLGGPVVKERTFYFANFEQTRQHAAGVIAIDANAVSQINAALDASAFPGPRISIGGFPSSLKTTNLLGRVDHRWSEALQSAVRYSFYQVDSPNSRNVGGLSALSRGAGLGDRDQTIALSNVWTISPQTLVEARGQYTRSRLAAPVNDAMGPAVNISGVANFGTATFSPTGRDMDEWQMVTTLTHQRGHHSIKAGADYLHNLATITFPGALQGVYSFANLSEFLAGRYINFQQAFGIASTHQSNPNLGVFVEDEWRAMPGVTVNAGVRYDLQFLPDPIHTDADNIAPRVGIAWDPWRDGKTVVRANYGVFYDRIPLRAVANALQRDGIQYKVALVTPAIVGAPVFPSRMETFPAGMLTNITTIDPHIEVSHAQQMSLQVQRSLATNLSVSVGYQHLRGKELIMSRNLNVPTTSDAAIVNLGRPNPDYANNGQYQSVGDSWYDGLTVSLDKRAGSWAAFRLSYTFSKALDDAGNFFFSSPQDNFDVLADKGLSDNDQRHRLVWSGTFNSPVKGSSMAAALGRGWMLSYIFSYASALPFNIQTGTDRNGDTNVNDRPPGVGRNSGVGFDYQSLDVRLGRTIGVTDRLKLQTTLDAFNVLNHRNNMLPNNIWGTGATPRASFGLPTAVGDPRQVQLGLRLAF